MKSREEKSRREKEEIMQVREMLGKARNTVFSHVFAMICGSGGSKSRLAKAAGAEPWPDEKWTTARRCGAKHISKSKCAKHTSPGPFFGSWDVGKLHAAVARSTFPSQNAQNTPFSVFGRSDAKTWHGVVARSTCSSQNVQTHTILGPFLEDQMPEKLTPLGREAHFQVR